MDNDVVAAYLARIGAAPVPEPTESALRELCERHVRSVPFENLGIHLGEPRSLDEDALVDKIVRRGRGGLCFELNGLFALLLTALGYRVTLLGARVFPFQDGSTVRPSPDHVALRVDLARPWLVDVGFGPHASHPLRLTERGDQTDPAGRFELRPHGSSGDVDLLRDGIPAYRIEDRPRTLADFRAACRYQQTSRESVFTRLLICSLPLPRGHVTLYGQLLIRTVGDAHRGTPERVRHAPRVQGDLRHRARPAAAHAGQRNASR